MGVKRLSGGAIEGLVGALTPAFSQATGLTLQGDFGAVGGMRDRVRAGEAVDVVILTRAIMDDLAAQNHVAADTVADVGRVATCIAVRSGDAKPSVRDAAELRDALLAADAIHLPDPERATGGIHFAGVLRDLGIADAVAERLRPFPNGMTAMAALAASPAERPIGCTQLTEVRSTDGVDFVAPLPPGHELSTMYAIGVSSQAANPDGARDLARLLTSPQQATARQNAGFTD